MLAESQTFTNVTIGVASALAVSLVMAYVSRRQDHKRWLREKRHELYAGYIEVAYRLSDLHAPLLSILGPPSSPWPVQSQAFVEICEKSDDEILNLERVKAQIELIGSHAMIEKTRSIRPYRGQLLSALVKAHDPSGRIVERSEVYAAMVHPGEVFDYIMSARRDVDAEAWWREIQRQHWENQSNRKMRRQMLRQYEVEAELERDIERQRSKPPEGEG